ncbi:Hypothetical predicted protein [Podarcis lilfordi]|uniref:Reverse transcriptase domain-containing protein n=1 Tax=Podarcis lilfordi TaxID=74358 RepID=A0AA35PR87_9SAUR|nr:Hypothetical predicted protein [Podarcis lilfordi]
MLFSPWNLKCGVPQGSILSHTSFNIYMNPLGGVIRRFGVHCQQYADDTWLYFSFTSAGEAMEVLDQCLDSVMDWKKANKLKLNPDKIEALLVAGSLDQMAGRSPALEGVTLPLKEQDTHAANPEVTGRLSVATPAQERAPAGRTCAEAGYHRSRMCRSGPPPHSQKWATAPRTCAEQAHLDTDFLECTRTPGMN